MALTANNEKTEGEKKRLLYFPLNTPGVCQTGPVCRWNVDGIRTVTFSAGRTVSVVEMRCTLLSTSMQMSASKPPGSHLWRETFELLFTREIRCLPHTFLQHRILWGASWDAFTVDLTFLYLYSDEPPSFYLPPDMRCNLWRVCNYLRYICTML